MTHLVYIVAAYGLFVAVAASYGIDAALRTGRARRRLAAIDTRARR